MPQLDPAPFHASAMSARASFFQWPFFVTGHLWLSSAMQDNVDISRRGNKFHCGSSSYSRAYVEISRIYMKTNHIENPMDFLVGTVTARG